MPWSWFDRILHLHPVDAHAAAFHPAEPSHLSLGKLVDGNRQLLPHLLIAELPQKLQGHEFVFQAV